jgi:hypothetical protein
MRADHIKYWQLPAITRHPHGDRSDEFLDQKPYPTLLASQGFGTSSRFSRFMMPSMPFDHNARITNVNYLVEVMGFGTLRPRRCQ